MNGNNGTVKAAAHENAITYLLYLKLSDNWKAKRQSGFLVR
jgi:hypothetical protein